MEVNENQTGESKERRGKESYLTKIKVGSWNKSIVRIIKGRSWIKRRVKDTKGKNSRSWIKNLWEKIRRRNKRRARSESTWRLYF